VVAIALALLTADRKLDPKYPLFFYDEGYSADIELHQKTTEEQIVNLFASQVGTTELEVHSSYRLE
jgi:hypothetical protein